MAADIFNQTELQLYDRQLIMPGFGTDAQKKLKASRVLIVGAGGIGSPCALYLAAAGVGTIGLVDGDTVDLSNLQRQIIFQFTSTGKTKVAEAALRLNALNPTIKVNTHSMHLTSTNALDIVKDYDLVVDGSDNFGTRYLVNDVCVKLDRTFIGASVFLWQANVAVYNLQLRSQSSLRSATYRCLFPEPPSAEQVPDCNTIGVVGVVPGWCGIMAATEVIKVITNIGQPLANRYMAFDAQKGLINTFNFTRDDEAVSKIKSQPLGDYSSYGDGCATDTASREVTPQQLKSRLRQRLGITLVDVREEHEHALVNIGGECIPLADIKHRFNEIPREGQVILYCRSGQRSQQAMSFLQLEKGFTNLYHLRGGIRAYMNEK